MRGGRRSDGEVVEALVAEVDGEGLARRGRTRGAPTSGAEAEARGDVAMAGASQAWRHDWTAGELQDGRGWRWGWRCVSGRGGGWALEGAASHGGARLARRASGARERVEGEIE